MNKRFNASCLVISLKSFFICCLAVPAFANEHESSMTSRVEACIQIEEDKARLACYDKVFRATVNGQSINTSITDAPLNNNGLSESITAAQSQEAMIEQFGAEDLKKDFEEKDTLESIQSSIVDISKNLRDVRTFYLANGQAWREKQTSRAPFREDDTIIIEKGALTSHYLKRSGSNRRVLVERVK
uniref:hypothetical protein n=1 Tax=Ningiella ruwaisensis TaxID=2364274 RepID=UPI00109F6012|nr:hypothetical protein [Ningiella ruwaisensis]